MKSKMYSWRMQIIHKDQSITPSFSIISHFFFNNPPTYNQRIESFARDNQAIKGNIGI